MAKAGTRKAKKAKKAAPKRAVRKPAAKKPAPKRVVRKVVAKKAAPKRVVRKVVAKKAAPKRAVRKPAAKKPAPKRVVRKVVAKKAAPKRVVRKVVAKKAAPKRVVRKVVAKKAAPKRVVRKAPPKPPAPRVERRPLLKTVRPVVPRSSPRPLFGPEAPPPPRIEHRPPPPVSVPAAPGVVRRAPPERRVLILGAGLVSRPIVQYLLRQPGYHVTVASRTVAKAEDLVGGAPNGEALAYDMRDPSQLGTLVGKSDLTVSLLPYTYHPVVARACIERRKHLVTTSYVSDAMRALDADARAAGVTLLNEIGLDPGIDHMSAMRIIHKVQREGGSIIHFHSYCGGLPAPEANTNPLGYKFSWSPRGVLLAGRNTARFRRDGQLVEIPGPQLFENYWEVKVDEHGTFEAYPNRDSLSYLPIYGIESAKTILRGTFRNPGWCRFMKKVADLGLLDDAPRTDLAGKTLAQFTRTQLGPNAGPDLRLALAQRLELPPDSEVILKFDWLGLFSAEPVPVTQGGNLDVMTALMNAKMQYGRGERDMILLRHEFVAEYPGGRREDISSTLIDFGVPGGDSAMSRTVALPAAIASRMVLEGRMARRGVLVPVEPAIFHPVLDELATLGIHCVERTTVR